MAHGAFRLAVGALVLYVVAAWTLAGISPPPARGLDAPPTDFSALRALSHVEAIAKTPHPVGSQAHEDVRAYIVRELTALGVDPQVEDGTTALKVAGVVYGAHIQNVIATLKGTRDGPAILLAAHYDSVPQSRGASDDGSGVATLLETARALSVSPRLENDVTFLFTDAEEVAACGAFAFTTDELATHPIAVALNFEARGTSGAVALYDMSVEDGALIDAVAASVPRVVSNSLLGSLARTVPNDSDASLWKRAGIPTYAFAYVDQFYRYHRYTDAISALDVRSLQHDGDYALPLVRYLGHASLPLPVSPAVTFFDVFGRSVVSYSTLTARALALLTVAAFVALVRFARSLPRAKLTLGGLAAEAGLAAVTVLAAGLAALLVHLALRFAVDPFVLFASPMLATATGLAAGAAAFVLLYGRALRKRDATRVVLGGLTSWAVLLALTAVFCPTASFVFQWPLLFAIVGAWVWLRRWDVPRTRVDLALLFAAVPAAFFWSYLGYTLFVMLGPQVPEVVTVAAALPMLLSLPALARMGPLSAREIAWAAAIVAVPVALLDGVLVHDGKQLQRPDRLSYSAEQKLKNGVWATDTPVHDDFVLQKIPEGKTSSTEPAFALVPPDIEASGTDEGALRHGTLTVTSPRRARCLRFYELTKEPIVKALVNDKPVVDVVRFSAEIDEALMRLWSGGGRQAAWVASYCGAAGDPLKLDLFSAAGKPVKLRVVEVSDGLPGPPLRPRGASDGYPDWDSDVTSLMVDVKL